MKELFINGRPLDLPDKFLKDGIEAEIYRIEPEIVRRKGTLQIEELVIKLYREPDDPFYGDDDSKRAEAEKRLIYHQSKLKEFPQDLPEQVVTPQKLVTDKGNRIVGFSMRFIEDAEELQSYDRKFRENLDPENWRIVNNIILPVFKNLHQTVSKIHENKADVVIGDFNGTNVMVRGREAYIIDADSMQIGRYPCELYKDDYLEPGHMDKDADSIVKKYGKKYTRDSDWYAYTTMLLENLLFTLPYGGKYEPDRRISKKNRIDKCITIFHDMVTFSNDVIHPDMLPDDVSHHFYQVFVKGERGVFPVHLLDMRWTKCTSCGAEHARTRCPNCYRTTAQKKPTSQGEIKSSQTVTSGSAQTGVPASAASPPMKPGAVGGQTAPKLRWILLLLFAVVVAGVALHEPEKNLENRSEVCTFSANIDEGTVKGTVYINNGKIKSDFTRTFANSTWQQHLLLDSQMAYVWGNVFIPSFNFVVNNESFVVSNQRIQFKCQDWSLDNSVFKLPASSKFKETEKKDIPNFHYVLVSCLISPDLCS